MIKLPLCAKNWADETPTSEVDADDIVNVVGVVLVEINWSWFEASFLSYLCFLEFPVMAIILCEGSDGSLLQLLDERFSMVRGLLEFLFSDAS